MQIFGKTRPSIIKPDNDTLKTTDKRSKTMKNERNRLILFCLRFYSLFGAWKIVGIYSVIVFQICIYHNVVLLLFILPGQSVWVTLCLHKAVCHNVVLLFILPGQSVWVTHCLSKAICITLCCCLFCQTNPFGLHSVCARLFTITRFKRTLTYFSMDTQYANFWENPPLDH